MSERYVSLAEVKDILTEANEARGGFVDTEDPEYVPSQASAIQRAALLHSQAVCKLTKEQADELIAKVRELEFVTETTSYKIADILPKYPEDVRAIFSKERITLEADDIQKVLDIVGEYL
ncbi:MAG: hypothetical protein J5673_02525 [Candidatus Methanomethylophilaceae archaeon]|nr:hypothetical protein [Candidatus Methanomethylophilaceae archaeon]